MDIQGSLYTFSLSQVYKLRQTFFILPSCQRENIWKPIAKQLLIDSILRDIPIPPLALIKQKNAFGEYTYALIDGWQRWNAIMEYMDNKYATAKQFRSEVFPPVCPGMKYVDLPIDAKSAFDNYSISFVQIQNVDDKMIGLVFRRWQGGAPLTLAEKIYSYDSDTKQVAETISDHHIWRYFYRGRTNRKDPYQAGVKMIILETLGIFSNLTTRAQTDVLLRDNDLMGISDAINRRLSLLERLFDGSSFDSLANIILAYQCIMLLEENGYFLSDCDLGCLSPWFMNVKEIANTNKKNGINNLFGVLDKVWVQREFWAREFENVCSYLPKAKRAQKRGLSINDKIILWNKQSGRCFKCNQQLRFAEAIGHHVDLYSNGGETSLNNIVLVHQKCHKNIHESQTNYLDLTSNI